MATVDLYDGSYNQFSSDVRQAVRLETYGEDIGQSSWMSADELRHFIELLHLNEASALLEVGSGSGGPALFVSKTSGCRVVGVDINEFGIQNANELARKANLDSRVRFQQADASKNFHFENETFDAIFSNDALCHIPGRLEVLREWCRVLKPGGRMLFTDALVITGIVSHEEIAARSSIGYYLYSLPAVNEGLIQEAGFELLACEDLTENAANLSRRWHEARANHAEALIVLEGQTNFTGLQKFLWSVHVLSSERRLSRFMYQGRKPQFEKTSTAE